MDVYSIVSLLKPERDWIQIISGLKHVEDKWGIPMLPVVNRLSKNHYDEKSWSGFYMGSTKFDDLRRWAEEDSPAEYRKLTIIGDVGDLAFYYTIAQAENWMRSCIYRIGGSFWVIRQDGRYSDWSELYMHIGGTTKGCHNLDILNRLESKAIFRANCFDRTGFWPELGNRGRIFNMFSGLPVSLPFSATDVSRIIRYIRKAAGAGTDYVLNWLAHIVQKPMKRLPTALAFTGDPGIFEWIGENIFQEMYLKFCENDKRSKRDTWWSYNKLLMIWENPGPRKFENQFRTTGHLIRQCKEKVYNDCYDNNIIVRAKKIPNVLPYVVFECEDHAVRIPKFRARQFIGYLRARNIENWNPLQLPILANKRECDKSHHKI